MDSPAWHLVHALNTLVSPDGNTPAIPGFADKARPLSATEKAMIEVASKRLDEATAMKQMGVKHWIGAHTVDVGGIDMGARHGPRRSRTTAPTPGRPVRPA